jgi:hypothetical protein
MRRSVALIGTRVITALQEGISALFNLGTGPAGLQLDVIGSGSGRPNSASSTSIYSISSLFFDAMRAKEATSRASPLNPVAVASRGW